MLGCVFIYPHHKEKYELTFSRGIGQVTGDVQAVALIKGGLGMGFESYALDKKVKLLQDPVKYLTDKRAGATSILGV